MAGEVYRQYELIRPCDGGETHWTAWFDISDIKVHEKDGWTILYAWDLELIRSDEGHLVQQPSTGD